MWANLAAAAVMSTIFMVPFGLAWTIPQDAEQGSWYLLVRRADRPEKNYYELTRNARFMELPFSSEEMMRKYNPSPHSYGADIMTDSTVRYGVYQAWKVRIIATSDTQKTPISVRDGVYVLSYSRNPDWKFAVKKFNLVRTPKGGQDLSYTDLQDGREYSLKLTPDWPRPWTVYEVEVLSSNAFVEIYRTTSQLKTNPQGGKSQ